MSVSLPGAVLGVLGGGQLARMTALSARQLGARVVALDPHEDCPAAAVVDALIVAPFDDVEGAREVARRADAVTFDIERIGAEAAEAVSALAPLRPGAEVLKIIQDRRSQKAWLQARGFPIGAYRDAVGVEALAEAARALGPSRAKAARGGYDGRGQAALPSPERAAQAFAELGGAPAVVERELDLRAELSVMVARRPSGEARAFPPSYNVHHDSILDIAVIPAPASAGLSPERLAQAEGLALRIAEALSLEGLLAVELFFTADGALLVNELAPRPHNSYHHSHAACFTSQFEQLVRAALDLPLGDPSVHTPTAMANLLGDLWLGPKPPPLDRVLAMPGVQLHLYDKAPRPKRKVGHLLACAATPEEAMAKARAARALLEDGVRG